MYYTDLPCRLILVFPGLASLTRTQSNCNILADLVLALCHQLLHLSPKGVPVRSAAAFPAGVSVSGPAIERSPRPRTAAVLLPLVLPGKPVKWSNVKH